MRSQNTKWFAVITPLGRGFRWKEVSAVMALFRTVGIGLSCKRQPSVLFYNASGFIILQFNTVVCNYGLFQLILNVINCFGQWCVHQLRKIPWQMLIRTAVQPLVLSIVVALIQWGGRKGGLKTAKPHRNTLKNRKPHQIFSWILRPHIQGGPLHESWHDNNGVTGLRNSHLRVIAAKEVLLKVVYL